MSQKVTGANDDANTDFTLEVKSKIINDSSETKTLTIDVSLCKTSEFNVPDNNYIRAFAF